MTRFGPPTPKVRCRRIKTPDSGIAILAGPSLADPLLGWQLPLGAACEPGAHLWPPKIVAGTTCLCGAEQAVLRYTYPKSQRGAYLVCEPKPCPR
jgi:hypothetical protein